MTRRIVHVFYTLWKTVTKTQLLSPPTLASISLTHTFQGTRRTSWPARPTTAVDCGTARPVGDMRYLWNGVRRLRFSQLWVWAPLSSSSPCRETAGAAQHQLGRQDVRLRLQRQHHHVLHRQADGLPVLPQLLWPERSTADRYVSATTFVSVDINTEPRLYHFFFGIRVLALQCWQILNTWEDLYTLYKYMVFYFKLKKINIFFNLCLSRKWVGRQFLFDWCIKICIYIYIFSFEAPLF